MKMILLLVFLTVFLCPAFARTKIQPPRKSSFHDLIGTYSCSDGFTNASYKIVDGSQYVFATWTDAGPGKMETGSYTVKDDLIHIRVSAKSQGVYNLLDPEQAAQAYREFYDPGAAKVRASKIKTEYDMQVVRWGGRIYLVEPELLRQFVAAVNFEVEPGYESRRAGFPARFFLREGDEKKPLTGRPLLPDAWNKVLREPS